jgi:hypothetical protein
MMRQEYKYLVPNELLPELREMLLPYVVLDPHAAKEPLKLYTVRSIYFDTPSLQFYYEKIEGFKDRKKLRIRSYYEYSPDSKLFLEIKRKYERSVFKNRALTLYDNARDIFNGGDLKPYLLNGSKHSNCQKDAEQFFFHIHKMNLRPTILIVYEREAYFDKFDDTIRITFDRNLRSYPYPPIDELFRNTQLMPSLPNHFVLEVKFNRRMPLWIKNIIGHFGFRWQSVSKYTICIDTQKRYGRIHRAAKHASVDFFKSTNGKLMADYETNYQSEYEILNQD